VLELVFVRFIHLVDAATVDGEFPTVIDATQPAFFIAAEEQRSPAVRTIFIQKPDAALRIAKGDQILAQQPHAYRRAIGLGDLAPEQRRNPVPSHRFAHRGTGRHPGDQLVFLARQH
jgi:hypothetical protein